MEPEEYQRPRKAGVYGKAQPGSGSSGPEGAADQLGRGDGYVAVVTNP